MSDAKAISQPTQGPTTPASAGTLNTGVYAVFTASIFLSAGLLFMVQPMFGKMALPLLGGTPGVWNTAMVFFQASLLAGYCYAHALGQLKSTRLQQIVHLIVMASATVVLPLSIGASWMTPPEGTPTLWLLGLLAVNVGAPFFALSANAPLIQKWFSKTTHPHASDPYFLYAASNLGSFIGLLSYPFLIEPSLTLSDQTTSWFAGYLGLMALLLTAAFLTAKAKLQGPAVAAQSTTQASGVSWAQRGRWLFLSAVPSALLLSVTTHITTDVVAIPLLWVIPLSLYLLTFALVFSQKPIVSPKLMLELQPFCVIAALITMKVLGGIPVTVLGLIAIAAFFTTTMVAHQRLADQRPDVAHLTEFYIFMSLGGVIGGSLVALVAPVVFNSIIEYPALLILGLLTRPLQASRSRLDLYIPAFIGMMVFVVDMIFDIYGLAEPYTLVILILFVLGVVSAGNSAVRLVLLAFAAAGLSTVSAQWTGMPETVYQVRSFFGVHKVRETEDGKFRELMHGTTLHGMQALETGREIEQLLYFDREAGVGRVITTLEEAGRVKTVGVLGLGTGSIACYRQPGQDWTYFEIDHHVIDIARDRNDFTFLSRCAPNAKMVVGDGRLTLAQQPDGKFDLLLMDAFSSDAIPMHLITREAIALYRTKLSENGVLLINISNRYLDPEPALAALAKDAGLAARVFNYAPPEPIAFEKTGSSWVVMSADTAFIESLTPVAAPDQLKNGWRIPRLEPGFRVWTDDYSNIFDILR